MKPCHELDVDQLERYVLDALDSEAAAVVGLHIEGCERCQGRLTEVRENLAVVRDLQGSISPDSALALSEIGPFRIVRELGRGGMGVVYLAEQSRPKRRVALKILHPGMSSPTVLRRFEHEANLLGRLQHPGIAQIYEAGVAPITGDAGFVSRQPYLAMEYIEGQRLDAYADYRGLSTRQRMLLLAKICDAVHHAHVNGIIHRDLKPGNILVVPTEAHTGGITAGGFDDVGSPKILDFGVARATQPDLQTLTFPTQEGQLLGTVPFMSPEHVAGDPTALDARCDVYALGVIGFYLLSGRLPFELQDLPLPEAARVIRDEDPARLASLESRFRGDVDTIVAKALEKDPGRRYQSASELGADVRRYLRDEPIVARPPSSIYQLQKLVARHRVPAVLTGALFALVVGFGIWMSVLYTRAREAERVAVVQAETARRTNEFLLNIFREANPSASQGEELTPRDLVDRASTRIEAMSDQPEVQGSLYYAIGSTYRNLGEHELALPYLEKAVEVRTKALGPNHPDLADTHASLCFELLEVGEYEAALSSCSEGARIRGVVDGKDSYMYAVSVNRMGRIYSNMGDYENAEETYRSALAIFRQKAPADDPNLNAVLNNLAVVLTQRGDYEAAAPVFEELLADARSKPDNDLTVASFAANLGSVLQKTGRSKEAEVLFRESLAIRIKVYGDDHPYVARDLHRLGVVVGSQQSFVEAEDLLRQALAIREQKIPNHWFTAETRSVLGENLAAQGRDEEAEPLLVESVAVIRDARGADDQFAVRAVNRVVAFYDENGRPEQADRYRSMLPES